MPRLAPARAALLAAALLGALGVTVAPAPPAAANPNPPPIQVNGGGWIAVTGGRATFGFEVQQERALPMPPPIRGTLEYHDHAADVRLHSNEIDTLVVEDETAQFGGLARFRGELRRFTVEVREGGRGEATFAIEVLGDSVDALYAAGGPLGGGGVRIFDIPPPTVSLGPGQPTLAAD